jgi:hypothetical protein
VGGTQPPSESRSATINSQTTHNIADNIIYNQSQLGAAHGFVDDPTEDFDDSPFGGIPNLACQNVEEYARSLIDRGVLFVSGRRRDVVKSAGIRVVSHFTRSYPLRSRYLSLSSSERWDVSYLLKHTRHITESVAGKADGGKSAVVVVDIDRTEGLAKLEGAWRALENFSERRTNKLYFVFLLCGEAAHAARPRPELKDLPHWKTEPLSFLLDAWNAGDLTADLRAIMEKLPNESQAQIFVDTVADILKSGGDLKGVAAKWKETGFQQWLQEKAPDLKQGACERAAAFLGAFFPDLPFTDFDLLIKLLIEKERQELPPKPSPPPAPVPPAPNGTPAPASPAVPPAPESIDATEYWRTRSTGVLKDAGLHVSPDDTGNRLVRFADQTQGRALRTNFPDDVFLLEQLQRLYDEDLLLDPNTADGIAGALARVTAEMFRLYPRRFDEDWLICRVQEILRRLNEDREERHAEIERLPLPEVLKQALKHLEGMSDERGRALSWILFNRLKTLCEALHAQRPETLRGFLNKLIVATKGDGMLPLEVVWRLRRTPGFDPFYWFKQLLERGNDDTRLAVWRALKAETAGSGERQWEVLRQLAAWHPEAKQPIDEISATQIWALAFLYDWAQSNLPKADEPPVNFLLPEHPPESLVPDGENVVLPASDTAPALETRLDFLTSWIGHPAFEAALACVLGSRDFIPPFAKRSGLPETMHFDCCLAEILEGWHAHPAQAPAVAILVKKLKPLLTPRRLQNLRTLLGTQASNLLRTASLSSQHELRPTLMKRRQQALALAELLQPVRSATSA